MAEIPRLIQPPKADGTLSFLVVGHWGRRGFYNQSQVATQLFNGVVRIDMRRIHHLALVRSSKLLFTSPVYSSSHGSGPLEIVSDQVPNTGDKDEKFNKKRKKKNGFRLLKDEVMTSTKLVIGDVQWHQGGTKNVFVKTCEDIGSGCVME
ncbi:hypothetical protein F2Q68_00035144 [Brassica cretica]|uniref:Uncharacterized protein n=1 Tax=Brassica cretica TaxID=69181 RepID=A0A8S9GWL8_BRACR|nr:hypothetical protein F2Q68_00035144 [Brassica cretica]